MTTLYLVLYILAAICFLASVVYPLRNTADNHPVGRYNLVALGLFFFVLVPLIQTARAT